MPVFSTLVARRHNSAHRRGGNVGDAIQDIYLLSNTLVTVGEEERWRGEQGGKVVGLLHSEVLREAVGDLIWSLDVMVM